MLKLKEMANSTDLDLCWANFLLLQYLDIDTPINLHIDCPTPPFDINPR